MEAHAAQYWKQKTAKGLVPNFQTPDETGKCDMMLCVNVT
jgi:hypothetical protein